MLGAVHSMLFPIARILEVYAVQEDAMLIRRAQNGDADAFEALIAPQEKRIYALCLRMLGNREDAMDCAQDAMVRIWRAIKSYRRQASFATWCFRIATNACFDLLRKKKNRTVISLDDLSAKGFLPDADQSADPHRQAEMGERKRALGAAIAALPEDMRAALILRDMQGFAYEEVAEILQAPLGTVKSRINRARAKVRQLLQSDAELFSSANVYTIERRKDT